MSLLLRQCFRSKEPGDPSVLLEMQACFTLRGCPDAGPKKAMMGA